MLKNAYIFILILWLSGCQNDVVEPLDILWRDAMYQYDIGRYDLSEDLFLKVEKFYPTSQKTSEAILLASKSAYYHAHQLYGGAEKYVKAIEHASVLDELYPKYSEENDADWIIIMAYYNMLRHPQRDTSVVSTLMNKLKIYESNLSARGLQYKKIQVEHIKNECIRLLSLKELFAGNVYWMQKPSNPFAALLHYNNIIKNYRGSVAEPEALYRCVEVLLSLNQYQDIEYYSAKLSKIYQRTVWFHKAENLLYNYLDPLYFKNYDKVVSKNIHRDLKNGYVDFNEYNKKILYYVKGPKYVRYYNLKRLKK